MRKNLIVYWLLGFSILLPLNFKLLPLYYNYRNKSFSEFTPSYQITLNWKINLGRIYIKFKKYWKPSVNYCAILKRKVCYLVSHICFHSIFKNKTRILYIICNTETKNTNMNVRNWHFNKTSYKYWVDSRLRSTWTDAMWPHSN